MDTLPTREEIAKIIKQYCSNGTLCGGGYMLADALLARLRPLINAMSDQYLYGIKHIADERDALCAQLEAVAQACHNDLRKMDVQLNALRADLRAEEENNTKGRRILQAHISTLEDMIYNLKADLRACAEALQRSHACATYDFRDGTCQGCYVSEALARPGVREALT